MFAITQSRLLERGRVEQISSRPDRNILYNQFRLNDPGIVDGVDYHTLSWQNRSVNLDMVVVPQGSVVTGVKFVVKDGHLGIEVQATKFDFVTGTLFDDYNWIGKGHTDRSIILLYRPEPNGYCDDGGAYLSQTDFEPNTYIKFRPSDPDIDAGQTTIPFIDDQIIRPKNMVPLSGIGLYYKGKNGTGGYIAPSLAVYDMSFHIGDTF